MTRRRFHFLAQRRREPELMDAPALDAQQHAHALQGLARINRWSGSARMLWPPIRTLAREPGGPVLRILDIATGAGDVPIRLWHAARRRGLSLEIAGCDRSPTAVAYARRRADDAHADIRFFELDALTETLPDGYDILISSLFLHHLDDAEALSLLRAMRQAAGRLVLVNDLVRSVGGLALAHAGTRLLSTSEIVHTDGPRSVRAAYTMAEMTVMAQQAGLDGAVLERRWPARVLLTWRRPS